MHCERHLPHMDAQSGLWTSTAAVFGQDWKKSSLSSARPVLNSKHK